MKKISTFILFLFLAGSLFLTGCKKSGTKTHENSSTQESSESALSSSEKMASEKEDVSSVNESSSEKSNSSASSNSSVSSSSENQSSSSMSGESTALKEYAENKNKTNPDAVVCSVRGTSLVFTYDLPNSNSYNAQTTLNSVDILYRNMLKNVQLEVPECTSIIIEIKNGSKILASKEYK